MSGKPAATVGSMHICPLCSGTIPHVGGPVVGSGSPDVLINGKPAVTVGDVCTCAGPPDTIVQGNPTVLINGKPIACVGDMTTHGGTITTGEATVIIGSSTPTAPTKIKPIERIPFPKIRVRDKIGAALTGNSKTMKEAQENISNLENGRKEQDKNILDVYWKDEQGEKIIDVHKYGGKATLFTQTQNMEGESITITISDKDNNDLDSDIKEHTYSGTVDPDGIAQLSQVEIKQDWEQTENQNTTN